MSQSSEHDLQVRCVTWFRYKYPHLMPLFFAVPNGGYRNKSEAARLKAEGENAGVSDLILQVPNEKYSSLNIEMKAGTSQRDTQKVYQQCVTASGGLYILCKSYEQFTKDVISYIDRIDSKVTESLTELWRKRQAEELEKVRIKYQRRIKNTAKQ